jgi:hypothetical protein
MPNLKLENSNAKANFAMLGMVLKQQAGSARSEMWGWKLGPSFPVF